MAVLDDLLPGEVTLAAALSYELGQSQAKMNENYPYSFNTEMHSLSRRLRAWLVNPPKGEYTT